MAMKDKKAVVIGTGLGGLFTGTYLAAHGWQVTFCEALSICGGRFTHIDYEGFAVPTGAFHAFPGGKDGMLYKCLRDIGVEVDLVEPDMALNIVIDGKSYFVDMHKDPRGGSGFGSQIGIPRKKLAKRMALAAAKAVVGIDTQLEKLLSKISHNDLAIDVFDHLVRFSQGVSIDEASAVDIWLSLRAQDLNGESLLKYGNKSMIDAIVAKAKEHGAEFETKSPARKIIVENGRATRVVTDDGKEFEGDVIISNAGAKKTMELLGASAPQRIVKKAKSMLPAWGVGYSVRSKKPMHETNSIEFPIDLDHIAGIAPISMLCPALAPDGWHYSLAYQYLYREADVTEQVELGKKELMDYLGDDVEIFNTACYHKEHPAATTACIMGQHGSNRFPAKVPQIAGLYLVGQDVRGRGMAAEIVGDSSRRLMRRLG